ncbi:MAG: GHKL domain-containing protein, partial [Bdellovibrionales bacterium]|nr:GHKL domain-containing protein [Bdellovibrionales bacterium]
LSNMLSYFSSGFGQQFSIYPMAIFDLTFPFFINLSHYKINCELYDFKRRKFPFFSLFLFSQVLAFILYKLEFSFLVFTLPIAIISIFPNLYFMFKLKEIKSKQKLHLFDYALISTYLLFGLHLLDYPFLRLNLAFAPVGFMVSFVLLFIKSIVLPHLVYNKLHIKLYHELKKQKKAVDDANKAKSVFLANISHEIRTPMHSVLSFSDIGYEQVGQVSNEVLKDYFHEIRSTGYHLMGLLNDLLDLSKLEANRVDYNIKSNNMSKVVEFSLAKFKFLAKEKNIQLDFKNSLENIKIDFDEQKIIQVISNLLSNAIKFSYADTTIVATLEQNGMEVLFTIENEGVDIPQNELRQVFDKFVQSSKTRSKAGGTGLGLAICERIISDHRGKIWVDSNNNKTKFYFTLPVRKYLAA